MYTANGNNTAWDDGTISRSIPSDPANRHYQEVLDAIIA